MTPALIFLGVNPTAAVANDLVAAAIYKSVGAGVHWREGSPNLRLAMWLGIGSVPFAFAGAFIVQAVGNPEEQEAFLKVAIGCALLLAASTYALRLMVNLREVTRGAARRDEDPPIRPIATVIVGAVGGLLVGITSVGSGSVIMVTLLLLYPGLQAVKLVGTDLVQAVPLVLAAAISHVIVSGVDWDVLIPLVVGAIPGIYVGSKLANRMPQMIIRRGIVFLLFITGLGLVGVDPVLSVVIGVVALGSRHRGLGAAPPPLRPSGLPPPLPRRAQPAPPGSVALRPGTSPSRRHGWSPRRARGSLRCETERSGSVLCRVARSTKESPLMPDQTATPRRRRHPRTPTTGCPSSTSWRPSRCTSSARSRPSSRSRC